MGIVNFVKAGVVWSQYERFDSGRHAYVNRKLSDTSSGDLAVTIKQGDPPDDR